MWRRAASEDTHIEARIPGRRKFSEWTFVGMPAYRGETSPLPLPVSHLFTPRLSPTILPPPPVLPPPGRSEGQQALHRLRASARHGAAARTGRGLHAGSHQLLPLPRESTQVNASRRHSALGGVTREAAGRQAGAPPLPFPSVPLLTTSPPSSSYPPSPPSSLPPTPPSGNLRAEARARRRTSRTAPCTNWR